MVDFLVVGDVTADNFFFINEASVHCDKNDSDCTLEIKYGQKIPAESHAVTLGGNAANVSVGLSRMGIKTALVTTFGTDSAADFLKKELVKEGVNIDGSADDNDRKSNQSAIIVFKGERTILTYHDVGEDLAIGLPQAPWVYLTSASGRDSSGLFQRILEYKNLYPQTKIAFNPNLEDIKGDKIASILAICDVLIVNEGELARINNLPKIPILAVTAGSKGARVVGPEGELSLPAFDARVVDTTGAGDAFSSGFLSALFYGLDLKTALGWALQNSASVVSKIGGTAGLLKKDELN